MSCENANKSALVLVTDGTEDIEVTTCVDVLRRGGIAVTLSSTKSTQGTSIPLDVISIL
jgi:putative intracellular protease/amidase